MEIVVRGRNVSVTERVVEYVAVWIPSFNRDETVFSEPDRFLVDREPNRHLAFGSGVHVCIGAKIARLELRALLEAMLDEWDTMKVAGEVRMLKSVDLHGVDHIPIAVS